MGQKRLIDVQRLTDAARHHPPCAEEQREEAYAPSAVRQVPSRPAQDDVSADGHRADGQRVRDRLVPVVVIVPSSLITLSLVGYAGANPYLLNRMIIIVNRLIVFLKDDKITTFYILNS